MAGSSRKARTKGLRRRERVFTLASTGCKYGKNRPEGGCMSETNMRMVVVAGAAGRMGQTLLRSIHASDGMKIHAALERPDSPLLGKDAGELCGIGPIGVPITADPLQALLKADALIDFTSP